MAELQGEVSKDKIAKKSENLVIPMVAEKQQQMDMDIE